MKRIASAFWSEDEGNVAIDWVVLTAGIVSLGFAVIASIALGTEDVTADIADQVQTIEVSSEA